jgi:SulP family sulfate permease
MVDSFPAWLLRRVPALDALRGYDALHARGDLLAGLTVAAVAVPQAMAYGLAAGVPPEHGLYTAIVMTAVGALLDSSRQLINGPTNALSIAVLSALAVLEPGQRVQGAILMAGMIGAFQIAIAALRLGDLTRYVSHSVILGFTLGAGLLLPLDQLKNLLGLRAVGDAHDAFLVRLFRTLSEGGPVHAPTLTVGLGAIALTVVLRRAKLAAGWPLVPELLLTVVASALLTATLDLEALGVAVVGAIPARLPSPAIPDVDLSTMRTLAGPSLAIATLGLLEAISMARAIASTTRQRLDMNQQCLSEGVANFSGSFFGCIPGSGSLTRSTINQQAGARTQWSGVVSAIAVALVVVAFAPWARFIPKAALAGILFVSSWRMVDRHALAYHLRATRFDRVIVLCTAGAAVFVSIEFCVLVGVLLSFALAVPRAGRMLLTEFVVDEGGIIHERVDGDTPDPRLRIHGLEGEAFFGAGPALEACLDRIEAALGEGDARARVVVLRVKRLRSPDAVVMHLLDGFVERMRARGVDVLLCGVRDDFRRVMERTGSLARMQPEHVFLEQSVRNSSTAQAVRHARRILDGRRATAGGETPYYVVI